MTFIIVDMHQHYIYDVMLPLMTLKIDLAIGVLFYNDFKSEQLTLNIFIQNKASTLNLSIYMYI